MLSSKDGVTDVALPKPTDVYGTCMKHWAVSALKYGFACTNSILTTTSGEAPVSPNLMEDAALRWSPSLGSQPCMTQMASPVPRLPQEIWHHTVSSGLSLLCFWHLPIALNFPRVSVML